MHARHSVTYLQVLSIEKHGILYGCFEFLWKTWNKIISPALKNTLNKWGMASKFPRNVPYGSDLYEGNDTEHSYHNQDI